MAYSVYDFEISNKPIETQIPGSKHGFHLTSDCNMNHGREAEGLNVFVRVCVCAEETAGE